MATHSSILAWRIPWIEEPGRLHRVRKSRIQLSDSHFCGMGLFFFFLFLEMLGERVLVYVATLQTFKTSPLASANPAVQRADSSFISASSPWFPSLDCLVLDHPRAQSSPWTGTLRPGRGSDAASSQGPWCCRGRGGRGTTGQGRILPSLVRGSELDGKAPGQALGHPRWRRD